MKKRDRQLIFKVSDDEKVMIQKTAEKLDIPISQFCRKTVVSKIQSMKQQDDFEDMQMSFFE